MFSLDEEARGQSHEILSMFIVHHVQRVQARAQLLTTICGTAEDFGRDPQIDTAQGSSPSHSLLRSWDTRLVRPSEEIWVACRRMALQPYDTLGGGVVKPASEQGIA